MTSEDPDQPQSEFSQGDFQEFDPASPSETSDGQGELGVFSLNMLNKLGRTIENELIPRLMLAFDSSKDTLSGQVNLADHVDEFVQLLVEQDAQVAVRYLDTLRAEGFPLATLYLDLLGPSARRLGVMWEEDSVSFTDVTIGVCRMHQVLLEFSRCFDAVGSASGESRNALILPSPGEQHTFGLFMVMEFLRRDGWTCYSGTPATNREFMKLVKSQPFELIGLSVSFDEHVDEVTRLISDIRRVSGAKVMVGGRCFLDRPELVSDVGADAMASDGREAVRIVGELVQRAGETD